MREGSRASAKITKVGPLYGHLLRRDTPLAIGETYHVFNRGAHKSNLFKDEDDYRRFLLLMFLANRETSLNMRDLTSKYKGRTFAEMFMFEEVAKSLVDVLAYSLMPNHFHIVLQQKAEEGISSYMKKVATAYSMYFNLKYSHSGTLFQGRYKSSHIAEEPYYRWIFSYVHLNPIALREPKWEEQGILDPETVRSFLRGYPYSSYFDHRVGRRPESKILATENLPDFLREQDDLKDMLATFTKVRPL